MTIVLLSIKPQYARLIIDGSKRVEFRKTRFSRTPTQAIVYAGSPVMRVLGHVEVAEVRVDSPEALWSRYADATALERIRELDRRARKGDIGCAGNTCK